MIHFALLGEDNKVVAYRPNLLRVIKDTEATIFLQQVYHYWYHNNCEAFYKFVAPCDNELYRKGDSWTERLGFSRHQIEKCLKILGTKITAGTSKAFAMEQDDLNYCILWWTSSHRVSYYTINPKAFNKLISEAYAEEIERLKATSGFQNYLGTSESDDYLVLPKVRSTYPTEKTTEINTDILGVEKPTPKKRGRKPKKTIEESENQPRKMSSAQQERHLKAVEVFNDWVEVTERAIQAPGVRGVSFGGKREETIKKALTKGYSVEDLKLAIRGNLLSDWHMGKNQKGIVYDEITYICEDFAKLERFRDDAITKGVTPDAKLRKSDYVRGGGTAVAKESDVFGTRGIRV